MADWEKYGTLSADGKTFTFNDNDNVTKITQDIARTLPKGVENAVGNGVETIGKKAFLNCSSLKTVKFDAATSIGEEAFYNCSSLETVIFDAATSIGNYAFYGCSSLKTVKFDAATSIGNYAFYGCSSLETAKFKSATSIGVRAFYNCSSLTTAEFKSATSIGVRAFDGCSSLETVIFDAATSMRASAFEGCISLKTAPFPKVKTIEPGAFKNCSSLKTVEIPETTSIIGQDVFLGCTALEKYINENGVQIEGEMINLTTLFLQVVCGSMNYVNNELEQFLKSKKIKKIYLEKNLIYDADKNLYNIKDIPRALRGTFERLFANQSFIKSYKRDITYLDDRFDRSGDGFTHEFKKFSEKNLYPHGEPCLEDVHQAGIGDCWLISALASIVANDKEAIKNAIQIDNEKNTVTVSLFRCMLKDVKENSLKKVKLKYCRGSKVNITMDKTVLSFGTDDNSALWVKIIEKAMSIYLYKGYGLYNLKTKIDTNIKAKSRRSATSGKEFRSGQGVCMVKTLDCNCSAVAMVAITGEEVVGRRVDDFDLEKKTNKVVKYNNCAEALLKKILKKLKSSSYVGISVKNYKGGASEYLPDRHAYSILGVIIPSTLFNEDTELQKSKNLVKENMDDDKENSPKIIVAKNVPQNIINTIRSKFKTLLQNSGNSERKFIILRNPYSSLNYGGVFWLDTKKPARVADTYGLSLIEISKLADSNVFGDLTYSKPPKSQQKSNK